MTIEYRPATKEDAELLVSIYDAAFYNDYLRFGTCPGYILKNAGFRSCPLKEMVMLNSFVLWQKMTGF